MTHSAYGLWPLVVVNVLVVTLFALSFAPPQNRRDWRTFGLFSAFLVALFTEMYGIPLTIYLLSGWLVKRFPDLDLFSHEAGHLWYTLLGWKGDAHTSPIHLFSNVLIFAGFILLAAAWPVLFRAQREGRLATSGIYRFIRHPQYAGFALIITGFFVQWPTLPTLVMYPILLVVYSRLARREEREVAARFPKEYARYAAVTPRFMPITVRGGQP